MQGGTLRHFLSSLLWSDNSTYVAGARWDMLSCKLESITTLMLANLQPPTKHWPQA